MPILFDVTAAFAGLVGVWINECKKFRSEWMGYQLTNYPRISIVNPVYNGADSLANAVQSLRKQTFPPKQIEVIVVDNGSTDETERNYLQQQLLNTLGHCIGYPCQPRANAGH